MAHGKLYMVPCGISTAGAEQYLPPHTLLAIQSIGCFICENARTSRRFIAGLPGMRPVKDITFIELDKHSQQQPINELLAALNAGTDVGVLAEAGCPGIADPGALIAAAAHREGFQVIPLIGPSSILLALVGFGMSGQNFAFHGYLSKKPQQRKQEIKTLENDSAKYKRTQLFIETPYRNISLLLDILMVCKPDTKLGLAMDLTGPEEWIHVAPCKNWIKIAEKIASNKPAVFGLYAG